MRDLSGMIFRDRAQNSQVRWDSMKKPMTLEILQKGIVGLLLVWLVN